MGSAPPHGSAAAGWSPPSGSRMIRGGEDHCGSDSGYYISPSSGGVSSAASAVASWDPFFDQWRGDGEPGNPAGSTISGVPHGGGMAMDPSLHIGSYPPYQIGPSSDVQYVHSSGGGSYPDPPGVPQSRDTQGQGGREQLHYQQI